MSGHSRDTHGTATGGVAKNAGELICASLGRTMSDVYDILSRNSQTSDCLVEPFKLGLRALSVLSVGVALAEQMPGTWQPNSTIA